MIKIRNFKVTLNFIAVTLFLFTQKVFSLGLGDIEYSTQLGEQLTGSVIIVGDLKAESKETLKVKVATKREGDKLGLEMVDGRTRIMAKIESGSNGRLFVSLSSRAPIREPFTDLVLILESKQGTVYRQYSVLLDI